MLGTEFFPPDLPVHLPHYRSCLVISGGCGQHLPNGFTLSPSSPFHTVPRVMLAQYLQVKFLLSLGVDVRPLSAFPVSLCWPPVGSALHPQAPAAGPQCPARSCAQSSAHMSAPGGPFLRVSCTRASLESHLPGCTLFLSFLSKIRAIPY